MLSRGRLAVLWCLAVAVSAASAAGPPHRVFAHYMTCFTNDLEFCKREIRLAQAAGLDGFAMDFGAWLEGAPPHQPTNYVASMDTMFEAARQLGTGFQLLLTPEYSVQPVEVQVEHMVRRYYEHPNAARHSTAYGGSAFCLAPYGIGGEAYDKVLTKLKADGLRLCFIPFSSQGKFEMAVSLDAAIRLCRQPHADGLWRFACDDSVPGILASNANLRRATWLEGKLYMAGLAPHYNSANVRDMEGLRGYGALWQGIIDDQPDWVEIVTWNDYNEDTNLMPYKWKRDWDKALYNRDGAYLDATAWYASAYKRGAPPAITQDKLFFAYRDRGRWQTKAWDPATKDWRIITLGKWPFTQIHDDVRDQVYASAFLTAPASLTVTLAGRDQTIALPAGLSHLALPMAPGVPRFRLRRGATELLDVVGRRSIIDHETQTNSLYLGGHLQSRVWAGMAVAGADRSLRAADATLSGGAQRRADGLWLPTAAGATIVFAAPGLKTGMANLRFRYRHAGVDDARVTLSADGVASSDPEESYHIPLWLPPTGAQWRTVSLMWPLYETTTRLTVSCAAKADAAPGWNDTADVLLGDVDLVWSRPPTFDPPAASTMPDLVSIPGGSFTLGGASGEADEQPASQVRLSPFRLARHEVTNAEYERYQPEHRKWRDGYSWRDAEPVIYVSWRDAAGYCNWLSAHNGLKPAYNTDTWAIEPGADGFRLPSEAQWEYVASGRGENRPYPWGKEPPRPGVQGNFALAAALAIPMVPRSQPAEGTTIVGRYPAGASRDGVLDLAGNVAEWCGDWYQPYTAAAKTDPIETRESHSRVLRGGSWGYYGHSQRTRDREFNSPGYPGYVFIGFRVALPGA